MMKSKYTAASALLAWLLVTGWLATLVIAKPAVLRQQAQQEDSARMAELRAGIDNNQRSLALMANLVDVAATGAGSMPLAMPSPPSVDSLPAQAGASDDGSAAQPQLSLVLLANGQRSAVIDGQVVRVGSRLHDGSRVRAIGNDWVRVQWAGGASQTHRLQSPLAAGLQP